MVRIVKTEFYKLKRYHILWAGVALMLLSVLLTLFTSMANDGSVWDFAYLTEQVIKNNMSMIFPMCISLIAGYMISREQTDDTLKNILTVPISFKKLLTGKLIVCGVLSIIFGLIISDIVNSSLRKKQKTTVTDDYYDIHEVADLDRKAQAEEAPEETSPNNT